MAVAGTVADERVEYVAPDKDFLRDVIRLGGKSAKKCFQCGTCTATCNVSYATHSDEPFPRKQMLWTQWGLKDRVLRDPAIWACHQCNDCSASCPRGAKPGDVLAALRLLSIERNSVPSFMARVYREPSYLPLIFGIPALVLVALLYISRGLTFPEGKVVYSHFIPHLHIEIVGAIVSGAVLVACGVGLLRFWTSLQPASPLGMGPAPTGANPIVTQDSSPQPTSLESAFASTIVDMAKHSDFRSCTADRARWIGHMAVLYGAPFLLFATALAALFSFIGVDPQRPFYETIKVTGNLGGFLLLAGVMLLAYNRLRAKPEAWGAANYSDWLLLWVIFLNVATGILTQLARLADVGQIAYPIYTLHLAIVFASFLYAPYGKFAHSFYRLAALTYLRHGGKSGPYKLYVLLPSAVAVGVGVVAVLAGVAIGITWLLEGAPGVLTLLDGSSTISLNLYLPVANVSVSLPMMVGTGFAVGVLSGMTGVGGGFLMTPLLMTAGIPAATAVGTDNAQIAGTASSGALAHWRPGNVDVKLGLAILTGAFIGGTIGVQIVAALRAVGNFDFWVRIVYVIVLGTVGTLMLRESIQTWVRSVRVRLLRTLIEEGYEELMPKLAGSEKKGGVPLGRFVAGWPLQMEFKKAKVRFSVLVPFGLGITVGMLAAVMGVGGGFIMVPSMIYILGVPTHVAIGTDLFQMAFSASNVAFQQAVTNHNVDLVLGVLLMVGAAVGAQVGARIGQRLEGHQLRTFLGAIVMIVMAKMLLDIVLPPSSLIGISAGGGGGH